MSEQDFYSFLSEEDDKGNISYGFITDRGFIYVVYFNVDEYTKYIEAYPTLLEDGYAFGFSRIKPDKLQKNGKDAKILPTINEILLDFFEDRGKNTVLLYHCDDSDEKQGARNKLFDAWNDFFSNSTSVEHTKRSVEVDISQKEGFRKLYVGYIVNKDNPKIKEVDEEFQDFSVYIIRPKD